MRGVQPSAMTQAMLRMILVEPSTQGHRIKIDRLGQMANSIFGENLGFCGICSQRFTSFFIISVVEHKYKLYAQ